MTEVANPAPAPTSPPPPQSLAAKISKLVADFWQLATAIIGIIAAIITGLAYFATHKEVPQLDCVASHNLLMPSLESKIEELKLEIRLAEIDLKGLPKRSSAAIQKEAEIEDFKGRRKKLNDDYDDELKKLKDHVCFPSEEKNTSEKKP